MLAFEKLAFERIESIHMIEIVWQNGKDLFDQIELVCEETSFFLIYVGCLTMSV